MLVAILDDFQSTEFLFLMDSIVVVQTRYVMKYRHCDGKLVLKVTDNKEVI